MRYACATVASCLIVLGGCDLATNSDIDDLENKLDAVQAHADSLDDEFSRFARFGSVLELIFALQGDGFPSILELGALEPNSVEQGRIGPAELLVYDLNLEQDTRVDLDLDGSDDIVLYLVQRRDSGLVLVAESDQDEASEVRDGWDHSFFLGFLSSGSYMVVVMTYQSDASAEYQLTYAAE